MNRFDLAAEFLRIGPLGRGKISIHPNNSQSKVIRKDIKKNIFYNYIIYMENQWASTMIKGYPGKMD